MSLTTKKILSFVFVLAIFAVPMIALGQAFQDNRGIGGTGLKETSSVLLITTLMKWLLTIITVLAVIGFIISGIYFITAGGSGRADEAKSWLTYSIIGIVVALIGYIVVNVVSNIIGGTSAGTY